MFSFRAISWIVVFNSRCDRIRGPLTAMRNRLRNITDFLTHLWALDASSFLWSVVAATIQPGSDNKPLEWTDAIDCFFRRWNAVKGGYSRRLYNRHFDAHFLQCPGGEVGNALVRDDFVNVFEVAYLAETTSPEFRRVGQYNGFL